MTNILTPNEDSLHFYCPKEDRNFTFVYQNGDSAFHFSFTMKEEQVKDLQALKLQFNVFAEKLFEIVQEKTFEDSKKEDIHLSKIED